MKRAGGGQRATQRGRHRGGPVVSVSREVVIGALLLGVVLLVAGALWLTGRTRGESGSGDATGAATVSEVERVIWQGPNPSEVAEKFTQATTHAERLKWVRQPAKVGAEMEAFFREGPGATEKVIGTIPLATSGQGELLYENYQVSFDHGEPRLLCVSVDPQGAQVDFEAYARHGSEKWPDLVSGAVQSAEEMRVVLRPGGFYMHHFPDESKWRHFKASTPDLPDSMDFYVERGSKAADELARAGDGEAQVTVSIRAVEDSAKYRQFEITAVKAIGWVEPAE